MTQYISKIQNTALADTKARNDIQRLDEQFNTIEIEKATKQELEVERNRINAFASLAEGSTTGDAELIDGRIGANGVSYSNIGENIRDIGKGNGILDNSIKAKKIDFANGIYNIVDFSKMKLEKYFDSNFNEITATGLCCIVLDVKEGEWYKSNFNTDFSWFDNKTLIKNDSSYSKKYYTQERLMLVEHSFMIPSGVTKIYLTFYYNFKDTTQRIYNPMLFKTTKDIQPKKYYSYNEYYGIEIENLINKINEENIEDNSISPSKTAFATASYQFLKSKNKVSNYYYATSKDGSVISNNDLSVYYPFKIKANKKYYLNNIYGYFSFIRYEDYTVEQITTNITETYNGVITPTKDGYLYVTVKSDLAMVTDNENIPNYFVEGYYDLDFPLFTNKVTQLLKSDNKTIGKYYGHKTTDIGHSEGSTIYNPIKIVKNKIYYYTDIWAYFTNIKYSDGTIVALSENTSTKQSGSFKALDNGEIYITVVNECVEKTGMFADGFVLWDRYVEDSYSYINNLKIYEPKKEEWKVNKINVKKTNGDFSKITDAINSIKDSSEKNRYEIHIYSGDYDLLDEFGGSKWVQNISHSNGEQQGLYLPDYVDLIGHGQVNISLEVPDDIVTYDFSRSVSTINLNKNNKVENINFTARNTRYTCHQEGGNSKYKLIIKNCSFKHLGNKSGMWISCGAWGAGTASGIITEFYNSIFESPFNAWGMHNNENQESCTIILDGCVFLGGIQNASITFEYYKTNINRNKVFIKNCIGDSSKPLVQVKPTSSSIASNNVWDIYNFVDNEIIIGSDN